MEPAEVLAAFDAQVRRAAQVDGPGARVEADARVVRQVAADGRGWSGVTWSDLTDDDADAVIARQVSHFSAIGQEFEWKLYDYDRPADLGRRLAAAGFVPDDGETLMVADVAAVSAGVSLPVSLPAGVRLQEVTGEAGLALVFGVHDRVFGTAPPLHRSLLAALRDAPDQMALVVATAGDLAVCSARIEFVPGRDFAGLWGGGTLPGWRGQGIYRALVGYRAQLAAARGYRYLQVDASPDSRPILERLGFASLARTTPYLWRPPHQEDPRRPPYQEGGS
jgi:GNAT superfamily N-acetyltransferase